MISIKLFEKEDIPKVIEFEYELRKQEPNTYYWEPDQDYVMQLEKSFADERFNTAISLIAHRNGQVIGRIDASIISSRSDASCFSAYLDWICVLKSERHNKVAQTLLEELKKAKKFIFIEYFIINNGTMWQEILDILKEKANSGLDVRVLYDDMGSVAMLPSNYPKLLGKYGIKCMQFNKLSPFAGIIMNNRDHRKMMIIDGHTAFSGGINISDEYININSKLGVWKDNGIRIKGEAVWNFTVMFLEMWNSFKKEDNDYNKYKYNFTEKYKENGFVVPYGESPLDDVITGEDIYLNIINQAKKYVYIYTPYLIIDTDMINSLILAARRGVDVRIIVPGIPENCI